jgi:hypothetical protein
MLRSICIVLVVIWGIKASAQNNGGSVPLNIREVSGIVRDSNGEGVIGATVVLTSAKDTLRTATNERGIFIFRNVRMATFVIKVTSVGERTFIKRFLFNDVLPKLILEPVVLGADQKELKEVMVNGSPTIVYKTDTAEYRAKDYKVRDNARLDELLQKMEGVEVNKDGTLVYQGQQVQKAKVNGKTFAGGGIAQAIQNLPAEIVDKVQFVNDYGDQAERTGIKDGESQKILNITTLANKSIGDIARITAGAGTNDRFDERLFAQRLNANEQLGFIGKFQQTVNGVASSGISASTPGAAVNNNPAAGGTTSTGQAGLNYRDQWGPKIQVNGSYNYNASAISTVNSSSGKMFSSNGTTTFDDNSTGESSATSHNFSFEFDFLPDSADFLRITPGFSYQNTRNTVLSGQVLTGYQNQQATGTLVTDNTAPSYTALVLYQHIFKRKRRNISIQFNMARTELNVDNNSNKEYLYDDSQQQLLKDSLQHFIVNRSNTSELYHSSVTFVEPLNTVSQIEFNGQVNYRSYQNSLLTDSVSRSGQVLQAPGLNNIYQYSFTETRIALNYRINKIKYNLSLGLTAIPTVLSGEQVSLNTSAKRTDFTLIPIFRYEYAISSSQRFSVSYSGSPTEPTFIELQPVADRSDPQNVIVGNPALRPSFRHTMTVQYNNYIPNSKANISLNATANIFRDKVTTNLLQVPIPSLNNFYNEYHYLNVNGNYNINSSFNISKQLSDRKYNLELNGGLSYSKNYVYSNNIEYQYNAWRAKERFGPRFNPADWVEVNPFVSYTVSRSFFSQPNAVDADTRITAFSVDGRFFLKNWHLGYDVSKNYIEGVSSNITKNPLVVNAYLERSFVNKNNGTLRIQCFDLFKQNNFINEVVNNSGITDTRTNVNSRYIFVSFILNLQKWGGTPMRNGKPMRRKGDGSFIY